MEKLYRTHVRVRYIHDVAYKRFVPYKKYSDLKRTSAIHKAAAFSFVISFIVFSSFQYFLPYYFSSKGRDTSAISLNVEDAKTQEVSYNQWKKTRAHMKDVQVEGEYTSAKLYSTPVQYMDENGKWHDIDTKIQGKGKKLSVTEAPYKAYFSESAKEDLRMNIDENYLINSYIDARNNGAEIKDNKITYIDAYPQTDIERIFNNSELKQNIVLKKPGHPTVFKEVLDSNLEIKVTENNTLSYYNGKKRVATTPPIILVDANGLEEDVDLKLEENILTISFTPKKHLTYPLVIDPSTNVYGASGDDAYVWRYDDGYGTWIYDKNSVNTILSASWEGGTSGYRSYLRFSLSGISGGITSASLNLYKTNPTYNSTVNVYHSTAFNPGTDAGETLWQKATNNLIENKTFTYNAYTAVNVATDVQEEVNAASPYIHFQLRDDEYTEFRSADYTDTSQDPYLAITYSNLATPTGFAGTALSTSSIRWNWTDNTSTEAGFRVHDGSEVNKSGDLVANTTQWTENSLSPNTQYSRHVHAFNGADQSAQSNIASKYTFAANPNVSETTGKTPNNWYNSSTLTFQNNTAFGAGGVQYYRYVWDTFATHTWTNTETQWSSGTINVSAPSSGSYYLHLKSYNGENVGAGTVDLGPFTIDRSLPVISSFEIKSSTNDVNFVKSDTRTLNAAGIFNDAGGSSGNLKVQLSQDGINWGKYSGSGSTNLTTIDWTNYLTATASAGIQDISGAWYLEGADGTKTVYVRTMDGAGNVSTTSSDTIVLDVQAPAAFELSSPASGTWQGSATPTLTWNASTDANGLSKYQLYVDGVLNRDNIASGTTSTTPTSALSEGSHTWYVKAFDTAGNQTQSTSTFTVNYDATVPTAPQSFAIENGIETVALTWDFSNNVGAPIQFVKVERIDWGNYDPDNPTESWSGYLSYKSKVFLGDTTGATFSVNDVDLDTRIEQGKKYAYRISGKDTANASYGALSPIAAGLTLDSKFDIDGTEDDYVTNVVVTPCDGTNNCSANPNVRHRGHETKITWDPATDNGIGSSHYLIYRSTQPVNISNYTDDNVRNSYVIVGVLPYASPQQPVWYDNDANNDGTTTFYDGNGDPITIAPEIQALTAKTAASPQIDDYTIYYYRIVAVDASNNKTPRFAESPTVGEFDVLKAFANGNTGQAAERTYDVSAPAIPEMETPVANGIDDLNSQPDPTQGILVSWGAASDNSNRTVTYKLYRSLGDINGPGTWEGAPIYTGTGTSYQDKGLLQDSYYYYRVTAQDPDTNVSGVSDHAGAKTRNSSIPTVPTYVTVRATKGDPATNANVGHEIAVSFTGSAIRYSSNKITGYEVYRSTTNYGTESEWLSSGTKLAGITGLNILGYDGSIEYDAVRNLPADAGLVDATTYYYRVRAVGENSEGEVYSSLSSIQAATLYYGWDTTPDATKPSFTSGLDVKVRDTHPNDVELRNIVTWMMVTGGDVPTRNGSSDFARYEVWREIYNPDTNALISETKLVDKTAINENYYTDNIDLSSMTGAFYTKDCKIKYYIKVVDNAGTDFKYPNTSTVINAYSNVSEKEYSQDAIIPSKAKPSLVGSVSLSNVNVASAEVSWVTDQDADSLVQYRIKGSNTDWITVGKIERSINHNVRIFDLRPLTEYEYQIVSRNYLGNDVENKGIMPMLKTTGFYITLGSAAATTSTADVTWTTNLPASSAFIEYQLQRQPGDDAQSGTAGVAVEDIAKTPTSHRVVVKGLRSNRTYTYKIKSISTDGFVAETEFLTFRSKSFDTTQFTLAPSSSNVAERNITATTALIAWQTATATTSWVDYSTKSGVYDMSSGNNDLNTSHAVQLEGLVPGTKYFYRVRVKDANEVEYLSQEYSFTAVLKPKVSNLQIKDLTPYSVKIFWETNVETETILNWGKTSGYGEKKGKNEMTKIHELVVENLDDNTEYHYQILAKDETGNEVADEDKIIRTPVDKEGPKITDVKTDLLPMGAEDTTSTIIISWKTNKPATTQVQYDEGLIGQKLSNMTTEDTTLNNSHTVIVRDLNPATTYRFRMVSTDKRGNTSTSNDYNFVTPSKEKSILQLIVKSLEDTFAWVKNVGSFFKGLGTKTK